MKYIYIQTSAAQSELAAEVLSRFSSAQIKFVENHWQIPDLHKNKELLDKWPLVKRQYLVIGNKAKYDFEPNGRSTDFIGPSVANGCMMSCAYCYVARRKQYANPVTLYANREQMVSSWEQHLAALPQKQSNQTHPTLWAYDIGCNNDISIDARLCNTPKILIEKFRGTRALASFATKAVTPSMLEYDPQGHTRIRFSLMPEPIRKIVDVSTDTTSTKIKAANDFYKAGYEVHFNFSPIIFVEDTLKDWELLFSELNDELQDAVKEQAAAELIMLTHNNDLHELNLNWHPKAEELLWAPDIQEQKISLNNQVNIRYEYKIKQHMLQVFKASLIKHCPWMRIRYAF